MRLGLNLIHAILTLFEPTFVLVKLDETEDRLCEISCRVTVSSDGLGGSPKTDKHYI